MENLKRLEELLKHSEADILDSSLLSDELRQIYISNFGTATYKYCRSGRSMCLQRLKNMFTGKDQIIKKALERTLVPSAKFKTMIYAGGMHVKPNLINDDQAFRLLKMNALDKSFFAKLPDNYIAYLEEKEKEKASTDSNEETDKPKEDDEPEKEQDNDDEPEAEVKEPENTEEKQAESDEVKPEVKKGRGRPKGSTNK